MSNFPPSISAQSFTGSAILVGFCLLDDMTINEQNAVGDWLMLVGQVMQTNASQRQVLEDRQTSTTEQQTENQYNNLKRSIQKIEKKLEEIEKNNEI